MINNIILYQEALNNPIQMFDDMESAIRNVTEDSFMCALQMCNKGEESIDLLTMEIRIHISKLAQRYLILEANKEEFIMAFATPNNQCYDTETKYLKELHSALKYAQQIFLNCCPRETRQHTHSPNTARAIDNSPLVKKPRQMMLFKLKEQYKPCVKALYKEIDSYFQILSKCIKLCHEVADRVAAIGESETLSHNCYKRFEEKVKRNSKNYGKFLDKDKVNEQPNELRDLFLKYNDEKAMAKEAYHKVMDEVAEVYVYMKIYTNGLRKGLTEKEMKLWKDNTDKALQTRIIIEHFDELNPAHHNGKIKAEEIANLFLWSNATIEKDFYEYFTSQYQGDASNLPTPSRTNTVKSQLTKESKEKFASRVETLLQKYENNSNIVPITAVAS